MTGSWRRVCGVGTSLLVAAGALLTLATQPAAAAGPEVGVADSLTSIRPTATPAALPGSTSLVAARNEYESFQIVVSGPATEVSVAGDLFGWSTTELYREGLYQVVTPSDLEAKGASGNDTPTGAWPDPLIPDRDLVYEEKRNAFPFDVPAGENRVVWVDVFVPPGTAPGSYAGDLSVTSSAGTTSVPVQLEVLGLTLPSSSTLPTVFMAAADGGRNHVCMAHTGTTDCAGDATRKKTLNSLYLRMGLENRLTQTNGYGFDYGSSPAYWPQADWETYFEGPAIRGGTPVPATAGFHLNGPEPTTVGQYAYADFHCDAACAAGWRSEATEAGQEWSDKVVWYGCDEANTLATWQSCKTYLDRARNAFDRPVVVTGSWENWADRGGAASGIDADILVPYFHQVQAAGQASRRADYDAWVGAGHELWLATACDAAGCAGASWDAASAQYVGSPGYQVDGPANQARAMPWLLDRFDATGELNWATQQRLVGAWDAGGLFESGMNGDGTLFYPGTPARVGGTTDIPIESIRLKRFRDGREDWEYLSWLRQRGYGVAVDAVVAALYPTMYDATWAKDGQGTGSLLAARAELADLVRTALAEDPENGGNHGRILYTSDADGDAEIWNIAHDGRDPRRMTDNTVADTFPAWSPDSSRIAFARRNAAGADDLWTMRADGTGATAVTANPAGRSATKPAWSPDGQWLYYVRTGTGADTIRRIRPDGTDDQAVGPGYDPDVASDGRVFHSRMDDVGGVRVYATTPGGAEEEITYGPVDEAVEVSPDGTMVTFSRTDLTGAVPYAVYVGDTTAAPDDLEVIRLDGAAAYQSAFSPDGRALVYVSEAAGSQLWRATAEGAARRQLTTGPGRKQNPAWGAPTALPPLTPPTPPVDPDPPDPPRPPNPPNPPSGSCGGRKVTVDLARGQRPTARADVIRGTRGRDVIRGLGGDDVVCGLGGDDRLIGGPGRDILIGGGGKDLLRGGAGRDVLRGGPSKDALDGGPGRDLLDGGAGRDSCTGGGRDTIRRCELRR